MEIFRFVNLLVWFSYWVNVKSPSSGPHIYATVDPTGRLEGQHIIYFSLKEQYKESKVKLLAGY